MYSAVLAPLLDQRDQVEISQDGPPCDENSKQEGGEYKSGVCSVPVVDDLWEGGSVMDDGVGPLVDSVLTTKDVVVAVELQAVHPPEKVVVRGPRHQ